MAGCTPLIRCAREGDSAGLTENLANASRSFVNLADSDGNTALHYAAKSGRDDLTLALLNSSASLSVLNDRNQTPLDVATSAVPHAIEALRIKTQKVVPAVAPLFASRLMKQSRITGGNSTFSGCCDSSVFFLYDGVVFAWNAERDTEFVVRDPRATRPDLATAQSELKEYLSRKHHVERGGLDPDFDFAEEAAVRQRVEELERGIEFVHSFELSCRRTRRSSEWLFCDDGIALLVPWTDSGMIVMRAAHDLRRRSLVCGGRSTGGTSEPDIRSFQTPFKFKTHANRGLISVDGDYGSIALCSQSTADATVITVVLLDVESKGGFDEALMNVSFQSEDFGGCTVSQVTLPGSAVRVRHLDHTDVLVSTTTGSFCVRFDRLHRGQAANFVRLTSTATISDVQIRRSQYGGVSSATIVESSIDTLFVHVVELRTLGVRTVQRVGPGPSGCILHSLLPPMRQEVVLLVQFGTRQEVVVVDLTSNASELLCRLPRPSSLRFTDETAAASSVLKFAMSRDGSLILRYNVTMQVMTLYVLEEIRAHPNVRGLPFVFVESPSPKTPTSHQAAVDAGVPNECCSTWSLQVFGGGRECEVAQRTFARVCKRHQGKPVSSTESRFESLLSAAQCTVDMLRELTRAPWRESEVGEVRELEYGAGDKHDPDRCKFLQRGPLLNLWLSDSPGSRMPCELAGVALVPVRLWGKVLPYQQLLCRSPLAVSPLGSCVAFVPDELKQRLL